MLIASVVLSLFTIKHLQRVTTLHFLRGSCPSLTTMWLPRPSSPEMPALEGQEQCPDHHGNCLASSLTFLPKRTRPAPSLGLRAWLTQTTVPLSDSNTQWPLLPWTFTAPIYQSTQPARARLSCRCLLFHLVCPQCISS